MYLTTKSHLFNLANQSKYYAAKQKNIFIIDLISLEYLIYGKLEFGHRINNETTEISKTKFLPQEKNVW